MTVQGLGKQLYSIELRDLFAMAAMTAHIHDQNRTIRSTEGTARLAYDYADAMLKIRDSERDKRPPG